MFVPSDLDLVLEFAPVVTLDQRYVSSKIRSFYTAFIFRENRRHGTERQMDTYLTVGV